MASEKVDSTKFDKDVGEKGLYTADRNIKRKNFGSSSEVKVPTGPSKATLYTSPTERKTYGPHKNFYVNVHGSIMQNSQKVDTQVSVN